MFERLWPWGRRKSKRSETRATTASNEASRVETKPATSRFFDELAQTLAPTEPFDDDAETRISELVLRIVDHLAHKRVEPPVMPALVPRVLAIVNEPEVDIVRLSQLIEQDLALGAKLLSVANSPAFGGSVEIRSVRKAVSHLGTEQVAQVAIGLACAASFAPSAVEPAMQARWSRLFEHGMATASSAATMIGRHDVTQQSATFLAGLFHDVGKALALRALEALMASGKLPPSDDAIVDEALYRVHAFPGEEFTKRWTLPDSIMQVCAQHHQLEDAADAPPAVRYVSLASSFDVLLRGKAAERKRALDEARVAARMVAIADAELTSAFAQAELLSVRASRMFAA
jgi:HD-like signal output (HDOD) protein